MLQACSIKSVLFKIVLIAKDNLRKEAHTFTLQICHEDLQITAAEFFKIKSTLLFKVAIYS